MGYYIVREQDGDLVYDTLSLKRPADLKHLNHDIRIRILRALARKEMYPAEIAHKLNLHEQKVYYHIAQLLKAGAIEVAGKKEIRGTTAKRFRPRGMNFALSLDFRGKDIGQLMEEARDPLLDAFLKPFYRKRRLSARIVVGSPDPHGPFKARARDGHYAIDLGLFLGTLGRLPDGFCAELDVDTRLRNGSYIIVGGPVTNLAMARVNSRLPARFDMEKGWGIVGKETYNDDDVGMIARVQNPFGKGWLLAIAGVRYGGTRAAVLGLTRFHKLTLSRFTGQKNFCCIVQGFDLNGDGKIDSVELLE